MVGKDYDVSTRMMFKPFSYFQNRNCSLIVGSMPTIEPLVGDDQWPMWIVETKLVQSLSQTFDTAMVPRLLSTLNEILRLGINWILI